MLLVTKAKSFVKLSQIPHWQILFFFFGGGGGGVGRGGRGCNFLVVWTHLTMI